MADRTTFFKIDRSIFANEILSERPFDRFHAWVWLIGNANYTDREKIFRGSVQIVRRGQLVTSLPKLAETWGWSVKKVRHYLRQLEGLEMVHTKGTTQGTTITIEKYAFFQNSQHTKGTTEDTAEDTAEGIAEGTHKKKGKKGKEGEEVKRVRANASAPKITADFIAEYFAERGKTANDE